ncbi:hypothetical protein [Sphingobium sp. LF-16]|uniref:hypothetical protein n=1 Tax=Sphingobium sp. LF-16 TaxID=2185111 RepID=UPI0013DE6C0D|nr:hypothetical protein [Sphingobium sp. LF-16]
MAQKLRLPRQGRMADSIFTAVDLSPQQAPEIIETLDFETLYASAVAQMKALVPDFDARNGDRRRHDRSRWISGKYSGR